MHSLPLIDGGAVLDIKCDLMSLSRDLVAVSQYNPQGRPFRFHQYGLRTAQSHGALHTHHDASKTQIMRIKV